MEHSGGPFPKECWNFAIGGETKIFRPGDSYAIPASAKHGPVTTAATRLIDAFEKADRYPLFASPFLLRQGAMSGLVGV